MRCAKWSLFIFLFTSFTKVNATHLRCGEIAVEQLENSLTVKIRVTVYTNTINAQAFMGGDQDYLDFGDGSSPFLIPEIRSGHPNYIVIDAQRGIAMAYYEIIHQYSETGRYIVSYSEPNRNAGILNFNNSVNTAFYTETMFTISDNRTYSSPQFLSPPLFTAQAGELYSFSIAAEDPNGYSLFYKLVTPLSAKLTKVDNYQLPDETTLNLYNGLVTWQGMFMGMARPGEYLLAAKVFQLDGDEVVGYILRDIQVIAEESEASNVVSDDKDLDENNRIFVAQGSTYKIKIFAESNYEITLQSFSGFDFLEESNVLSFETYDSLNGDMKVGVLAITPDGASLRDHPYVVTVRSSIRNQFNNTLSSFDINYLIYTNDVVLQEPIVLGLKEDRSVSKIYPNPTKGFITISNQVKDQIRVLDQNGKTVLRTTPNEEGIVDLTNLPQGLYLIETTRANKLVSRERVMKE